MSFSRAERHLLPGLADVLVPAGDGMLSASQAGVADQGLDASLIARVRGGDERAADLLVRRYLSDVYAVTSRVLLDGDLAQDAAQEAYARAWSRWRQVSELTDPRAWVARVGYNLVISQWRRAGAALRTLVRHGPPPPEPEPDPGLADTVAALRRLPEAQRRALAHRRLQGRPQADL